MERQEIIRLTKSIMERFHDNESFTEDELLVIHEALFCDQSPAVELPSLLYASTLEYLKHIVLEMAYKEVTELESYLELLLSNEEKEFDEMLEELQMPLQNKHDEEGLVYWACQNIDVEAYLKHPQNLEWRFRNLFEAICLKITDNLCHGPDVIRLLETDNCIGSKPDFYFNGSVALTTTIHASHFTDINRVFFIELKSARQRYIHLSDLKDLPIWLNHSDLKPCNVMLLSNSIENKMECHYDTLIDQLAAGKTIFDERFKKHLTEWLLYFKFKNLEIDILKQRTCSVNWHEWEKKKIRDIFYKPFHEIVEVFYEQFSYRDWTILKSPDGHSWLTTEDPGFSVDVADFTSLHQPLNPDPGLTVKNTSVVYFQLSKDYCLRIQPKFDEEKEPNNIKHPPITFKESSEAEFKTINSMTASTKGELLISADSKTLEQFITN
jgi:hypothetical protein